MKDKVLGKYYLDSFLTKIKEFTPNLNYKKNNFIKFNKSVNPLQKTKEIYKHRNKFEEKDLKELSILFLAMNNLDIFRKNIELISEVSFSIILTCNNTFGTCMPIAKPQTEDTIKKTT